jgi:exopolyphosphatase/guanosine-5'-triphosphate,3'-diphosphate pyrophosphatase
MQARQKELSLAAIDVGTNSIHMVVVRIEPSLPAFTIIARAKDTPRLGNRDPKTGELTAKAMNRAISVLQRCKTLAEGLQVEQIIVVATSAVREAPNGRDFIKQIHKEVGLDVDLISGPEEARRIYLGVLSGMEFDQQPHVIVDIGGGSTELILGSGQEPRCLTSTKVGAVRLTSEFVTTDPISNSEFQYLQAYIRGMLERPVDEIQAALKEGEIPRLVGTSGTIETLAMAHARQRFGTPPDPLNGYQLTLKDLQEMIRQLKRLSYAERAAIVDVSDRRAEIIIAGALILQEAMTLLGVNTLTVCERALREGVIVDWMITHGLIEDHLRFQESVRQRSVLKIAQKYNVNLDSSKRVAEFSLSLFDQLRGVLHFWGDTERELLWAGAILHNAGHFVSHSAHHKHSYYLIRHGELLGYTETEVEAIANLARYHRKSGPRKKHENYRNLTSKVYRQLVDQLSPILRLAVALDRRQIRAIQGVRCEYDGIDRTLTLHLIPADPTDNCALELWNLGEKKLQFEEVFQVKVFFVLETNS